MRRLAAASLISLLLLMQAQSGYCIWPGFYDSGSVININGLVDNVTAAITAKITTDNITEGGKLYWTTPRFNTAFSGMSTDNLTQGAANKYFSNTLVRGAVSASGNLSYDNSTGVFSTTGNSDNVSEGLSNLYFTNARARAALSQSGLITYNPVTGAIGTYAIYADNITQGTTNIFETASTSGYWRNGTNHWYTLYMDNLTGTVKSGTWNGTAIGAAYGGTGSTTAPTYGQVLIGNADNLTYSPALITAGTGITVTPAAGALTIGNTTAYLTTSEPLKISGSVLSIDNSTGTGKIVMSNDPQIDNGTLTGLVIKNQSAAYDNSTGAESTPTVSLQDSSGTVRVQIRADKAGNNTAMGNHALSHITSGIQNTAIGDSALDNNTTAQYCTAIGYQALYNNTTDNGNTAVGAWALNSNTVGADYNTAVGKGALQYNTTGSWNVGVGMNAGGTYGIT
ncbi:MAG: hypothetical protein L7F77_08070, partial [Candidatus Magnetominusculus sp. LBB02]|nr:hypothetical protein [Candidatus Magnetominusculus sp. LBB02]